MTTQESSSISSYCSLMDKHLMGYFKRARVKNHLQKMGLITKDGEIVPEEVLRVRMAKKEHESHVRQILAQTIVSKTLDMERQRQLELRRKLEELSKAALVRRIKGIRSLPEDDELIAYFLPNIAQRSLSEPDIHVNKKLPLRTSHSSKVRSPIERPNSRLGYNEENKTVNNIDDDDDSVLPMLVPSTEKQEDNSHSLPKSAYLRQRSKTKKGSTSNQVASYSSQKHQQRSLILHRAGPMVRNQSFLQSLCTVTIRFFGKMVHYKHTIEQDPEVMIEQQHCGGNTLIVFKDKIPLNSNFTFTSRRHRGFPFSLTLYINNQVDLRLSSCCEYKYRSGVRLGGKLGNFAFVKVEGAAPCYKCQAAKSVMVNGISKTPPRKKSKNTEELYFLHDGTIESKEKENSIKDEENGIYNEEDRATKLDDYEDDFENEKAVEKSSSRTDTDSFEEPEILENSSNSIKIQDDDDEEEKEEEKAEKENEKNNAIVQIVSDEEDDDNSFQRTAVVEIEDQSSEESVSNPAETNLTKIKKNLDERTTENYIKNDQNEFSHTEESIQKNNRRLSNNDFQTNSDRVTNGYTNKENLESDDDQQILVDDLSNKTSNNLSDEQSLSSYNTKENESNTEAFPIQHNNLSAAMLDNDTTLHLEDCELTDNQVDEIVIWLKKQTELDSLIIRNGHLNDHQLKRILFALKHTSLQPHVLNFNLNDITSDGVQYIVEVLKVKTGVQILLLHGNPLGDKGIETLINGLTSDDKEKSLLNLQWLDIGDCEFGDLGLQSVIFLLQESSSLTNLTLTGNAIISKNGFKQLAKALTDNTVLQSLSLDYCNLENPDIVLYPLKENHYLTSLDLEGNSLQDYDAEFLLQLASDMTSLKNLQLTSGNDISPDILDQIEEILKAK